MQRMTYSRKRYRGDKDAVIEVLAKENPKQLGSKAGDRFKLYKPNMTVREYETACEKALGSA